MDEILVLLLKRKAQIEPIRISTIDIGDILEMSQQNASRRLIALEKDGKILRRDGKISVTKKGVEDAALEYHKLKEVFEGSRSSIEFYGIVKNGLGEGKYYVKKYSKRIYEKIGFEPYPGTINIQLETGSLLNRSILQEKEPIIIDEFNENGRVYGGLFLYRCKVNDYDAFIIVPLRTHHSSEILELIAGRRLRERLGRGRVRIKLED